MDSGKIAKSMQGRGHNFVHNLFTGTNFVFMISTCNASKSSSLIQKSIYQNGIDIFFELPFCDLNWLIFLSFFHNLIPDVLNLPQNPAGIITCRHVNVISGEKKENIKPHSSHSFFVRKLLIFVLLHCKRSERCYFFLDK